MSQLPTGLPVLALCGFSGSGKTTLLEGLIPRLTAGGLAVAVVKHDAHGVQIDTRGKDSDRLFQAGADLLLRSAGESAARWHPESAPGLEGALALLAASHDLVLVEGHKSTDLPKIWLLGDDGRPPPPDVEGIRLVLAREDDRIAAAEAALREHLDACWRARPIIGGILIGGASRRMGRAKQLLELDGRTLLERVVDGLAEDVERVVLVGSGELPGGLAGLLRLPDAPGVDGPAAGILSALHWHPQAAWLVAACDQPVIDPEAVRWLLSERRPGRWAVLPRPSGGSVEPLLAVYEPQALALLERQIAGGSPALSRLAGHPKVATPEPPAELAPSWRSVNTPEDLESLRS